MLLEESGKSMLEELYLLDLLSFEIFLDGEFLSSGKGIDAFTDPTPPLTDRTGYSTGFLRSSQMNDRCMDLFPAYGCDGYPR